MKIVGALLITALAAAPAPAPPPLPPPPTRVAVPDHLAPASNYTEQATQTPPAAEYEPGPTPSYAEPSNDDGMRHCVGPDGVPIFTDRRCSDLGAAPRVVVPSMPGGAMPVLPTRVHSCARNQTALLDGVRAALENHDVNRLADFYHWSGMGTTEGYRLMERLDAFSERQVVDVQLVREARPEEPEDLYSDRFDPLPEPLPLPPALGLDEATSPLDPEAAPPPPRRRPLASMLRVDQMRSATDVGSTVTYFRLLTNAGCWWMRF